MLLSNISKIIEKLVHMRLTKFLNKYVILYEKQFGFRNNHSTTHALLEITEKIEQACDTGHFACGVFLDLQKAFDTVNHTILLKKLTHYVIRGVANKWFKPFLEDRKQFTSVRSSKSAEKPIKYVVPQGLRYSILMICTRQLNLAPCINLLMIQIYSSLTNLAKRLISILTEI